MARTTVQSVIEASHPRNPVERRMGERRRANATSLQMMFAPGEVVSSLGHSVFFAACDAAGINGETARIACSDDPDHPINSGAWSRMRRNDPNDPKRQPLRWGHVQRAYVSLGPRFAAEFDRLWREAVAPTDLGLALEALSSVARMAHAIVQRFAPEGREV